MFKSYAPLSPAVSPYLPERINSVTSDHQITVSEIYLRNGVPHIVLSHLLWDFRMHFIMRWVVRQTDAPPIALLEAIEGTIDARDVPQVFVYILGKKTVALVPQPDFSKTLHLVCRDIVRSQHLSNAASFRRLLDDIKVTFGDIFEPKPNLRVSEFAPFLQELMYTAMS